MNLFKYIIIIFFAVSFVACEDYFGENANVDPDFPTSATVNVLLPQAQARMAYVWGGDFTRFAGINTQHVDGVGRQFVVINDYGILPSDLNSAWSNIYSGVLNSNTVMMNLATENGANHYLAVGKLIEAYTIMMATDVWGDIPYSDAIGFADNGGVYAPTLDTQEAVYTTIFQQIADAKSLLSGDDGGNPIGGDDLFYGGDAAKWLAMANVLEARGKLHLSKVNGNAAYTDVISALAGGYASSADGFEFGFGTSPTENAPWFQYIEQRDDCEVGASYVALLESSGDPRLPTYGAPHDGENPVFVADQTVPLLSYTEQEFMKAEANLALGNTSDAEAAFISGVSSSMSEAVGGLDSIAIDGVNYAVADTLAGYSVVFAQAMIDSGGLSMEDIMTQKYIALYTSPEAYNDWRRTGIPSLTPNVGTEVPRRFPYSESEQFANENIPTPAEITIFDRVWWDQ